jgi:hypothetical protein
MITSIQEYAFQLFSQIAPSRRNGPSCHGILHTRHTSGSFGWPTKASA